MLYEVFYKKGKNSQNLFSKLVHFYGVPSTENIFKEAKVKYPVRAELVLREASVEEAKEEYCRGVAVFTVDDCGFFKQLTPSNDYGSHASSEVLFWRSLHSVLWYGNEAEKLYVNSVCVNKEKEI